MTADYDNLGGNTTAAFSYSLLKWGRDLRDTPVYHMGAKIYSSLPPHAWAALYLLDNISQLLPAAAKSLQSCLTLCDPIDGSPPGSPTPGILQARTLEWVAIVFSNAWKWKVKVKSLSHVRLFATPWTAAHQAPPSMGFPRQEYWSGVPLPSLNLITSILLTGVLHFLVSCSHTHRVFPGSFSNLPPEGRNRFLWL